MGVINNKLINKNYLTESYMSKYQLKLILHLHNKQILWACIMFESDDSVDTGLNYGLKKQSC